MQDIIEMVFIENVHYGTFLGKEKRVLMKPGADVMAVCFGYVPDYSVVSRDYEPHREYEVVCTLTKFGEVVGQGIGMCTSKESKYRYKGDDVIETDRPVPRDYWDVRNSDRKKAQELLGGPGFKPHKTESGGWVIAEKQGKKENHDVADTFNTVLKIAKKRAYVDAIITASGASHVFTQDVEDDENSDGGAFAAMDLRERLLAEIKELMTYLTKDRQKMLSAKLEGMQEKELKYTLAFLNMLSNVYAAVDDVKDKLTDDEHADIIDKIETARNTKELSKLMTNLNRRFYNE